MTSFKNTAISRYKFVDNAARVALNPICDTFDSSTLCFNVFTTLMTGSRRLVCQIAGLTILAVLVRRVVVLESRLGRKSDLSPSHDST